MFDSYPAEARDEALDLVRRFFFDHGHELAMAASLLGGIAAEARVVSCAVHLETAARIDGRMKRDIAAMHRLLSLTNVGDPDNVETERFSALHPASAEVEMICLLTDRLTDLLREIDAAARRRASSETDGLTLTV